MRCPTAADTLAKVVHARPQGLISADVWAAIEDVATHIPGPLASKLYLECHLAARDRRADLIVGVEDAGRDILAGLNPVLGMATPADAVWSAVTELCRLWAQRQKPLAGLARCWLELDHPFGGRGAGLPTPGFFVELERGARLGGMLAPLRAAPWLDALVDAPPALWHRVAACGAALPRGASIASLGFFPGRSRDRLRLVIGGLEARGCAAYLRTIAWPGNAGPVRQWLDRLVSLAPGRPSAGHVVLHLDVGRRIAPELAIEWPIERRSQLAGAMEDHGLLAALVADGLCSDAERRALERWSGARVDRLPHTVWREVVIRRINHLKLCFEAHGGLKAKAYLSVHSRPWPVRSTPVSAPTAAVAEGKKLSGLRYPVNNRPGIRRLPQHVGVSAASSCRGETSGMNRSFSCPAGPTLNQWNETLEGTKGALHLMNKAEFHRLVADVKSDADLRAEFAEVRDSPEKWVALARQKGYDITMETAKAIDELSDEDLEQVAGGASVELTTIKYE